MPNVAKVLGEEISRLAKKEARAATAKLTEQVRKLRKTVQNQSHQIAGLKKELSRKADKSVRDPVVPQASGDGKAIRVGPDSIKRLRVKLKLSQNEMGRLMGVSALTVSNWEGGKFSPRGENRETISALRKMRVREVKARLEKLSGG
jgi:DNA-binding transcriptional regulator YiaG